MSIVKRGFYKSRRYAGYGLRAARKYAKKLPNKGDTAVIGVVSGIIGSGVAAGAITLSNRNGKKAKVYTR